MFEEADVFEIINLTDAKARFSELVSRLIFKKEGIVITKKGKKVAVLLPYETYQKLEMKGVGGLINAKGALGDLDKEIDEVIDLIYLAREKEKTREVPL